MTTVRHDGQNPQTLADLKALNARFIHNFVTNDVASHDAILHPAFTAIQSNGERMERVAYLDRWKSGFDPDVIVYWDVRDERISLVGDVAFVRATNKRVVRRGEVETAAMTTYTDTYLCEGGSWKCVHAQITPVQPGHEPADDTIVSVYLKGVKQ